MAGKQNCRQQRYSFIHRALGICLPCLWALHQKRVLNAVLQLSRCLMFRGWRGNTLADVTWKTFKRDGWSIRSIHPGTTTFTLMPTFALPKVEIGWRVKPEQDLPELFCQNSHPPGGAYKYLSGFRVFHFVKKGGGCLSGNKKTGGTLAPAPFTGKSIDV